MLIFKGVLHQALAEEVEANRDYEAARAALTGRSLDFYLARSQLQLRLGQAVLAEQDARRVLEEDENVSRAWLFLGQSLQFQGRNIEAVPILEKAGNVALENGDNEIVVLARLALGNITGAAPP